MSKNIKLCLVYRDMWQSSGKYMPNGSQLEKIALSNLQNEDAFLFRKRGVNEKFIQIMFQASPEEMWYPTDQELFNYGVVTSYTN